MVADLMPQAVDKGKRLGSTGTCLVILWDFADHAADQVAHPAADYHDMIFSVGTFPTGSMNDYYREVSYGQFSVTGLASGWTTSTNTYASYENPDGSQDAGTAQLMLKDAIAQLDPVLDFSQFDNDGPDGVPNSGDDDGLVDALFFVHAGAGEESTGNANDIWSHAWAVSGGVLTDDGVYVYRYSVEPEEMTDGSLMTMGVFAHEYGHVLGLPDLYDTDYSSSGIGEWGLMSAGSWSHRDGDRAGSCPTHMTAWCKSQMGWLTPTVINSETLNVVVTPVETGAVAYKVYRLGQTGGDEYFLVENRRTLGFDEGLMRRAYTFDLPSPEGLLITHVDESVGSNSNDLHRLVDVVDASPWFNQDGTWHENLDGPRNYARWEYLDEFNTGDNGDLWPGWTAVSSDSTNWVGSRDRRIFSDASIPSAVDFSCEPSNVIMTNMLMMGDDVRLDFFFIPPFKDGEEMAAADRTWTFESGTEDWEFCNSFVHLDQSQADGCSGTGGLWFGTNDWDCPGYGNGWQDVTWVTVVVETALTPQVTIRHKYDLEPGYDYGYIEARRAGDPQAAWHPIAEFGSTSSCVTNVYDIPAAALADGDGPTGLAVLDLRLRLSSDSGWSAQDGDYCGIGWWVDEITVSGNAVSPVDDLPGLNEVTRLEAPSPNPFNPSTLLRYHVPAGARQVSLSIYDQRGHRVRDLAVDSAAGWAEALWNGRDNQGGQAASGLYFARLNVDGAVEIQKMALVK